jgi:hypothetical protein
MTVLFVRIFPTIGLLIQSVLPCIETYPARTPLKSAGGKNGGIVFRIVTAKGQTGFTACVCMVNFRLVCFTQQGLEIALLHWREPWRYSTQSHATTIELLRGVLVFLPFSPMFAGLEGRSQKGDLVTVTWLGSPPMIRS